MWGAETRAAGASIFPQRRSRDSSGLRPKAAVAIKSSGKSLFVHVAVGLKRRLFDSRILDDTRK